MPADSFSALLGLLEQATGNNNNSWGTNLNTGALDKVDLAIAGMSAQTVTGGTLDLSGTPPPAGPSGAIHAILQFSGSLASDQIVIVPNLTKLWLVNNLCTLNGHTLSIKTPSGTAAVVPAGQAFNVWCNGANTITVPPFNSIFIRMPDGSASVPAYSNFTEPTSGWYRNGTQDWRLSINGLDVLQVTGAGASTPSVVNILSPNALQLAGTPIRLPGEEVDYAGITEPSGWYFAAGQAKNRVTDVALFNAITTTVTGTTTSGSNSVPVTTDIRFLGLLGAFVEGTGIPSGTTITTITSSGIGISANATGSGTITIRILPYGQGDGSTTFNIPDRRGTFVGIRDDMNGTAKGLLTKSTSQGIDGTRLNGTGGQQAHTLTIAELPVFTPSGTISGTQTLFSIFQGPQVGAQTGGGANSPSTIGNLIVDGANFIFTGNAIGSGTAHNVVPPASIANRLIKR